MFVFDRLFGKISLNKSFMLVHHTFVSGPQSKCCGFGSRTSSPARHVVITDCRKLKLAVLVLLSVIYKVHTRLSENRWIGSKVKYAYTHTYPDDIVISWVYFIFLLRKKNRLKWQILCPICFCLVLSPFEGSWCFTSILNVNNVCLAV